MITLVWDPSFGNFRFETLTLELSFCNLRLGTFAKKPDLGTFRFWELPFGNSGWELQLGLCCFRSIVWDPSFGSVRLRTLACFRFRFQAFYFKFRFQVLDFKFGLRFRFQVYISGFICQVLLSGFNFRSRCHVLDLRFSFQV